MHPELVIMSIPGSTDAPGWDRMCPTKLCLSCWGTLCLVHPVGPKRRHKGPIDTTARRFSRR